MARIIKRLHSYIKGTKEIIWGGIERSEMLRRG